MLNDYLVRHWCFSQIALLICITIQFNMDTRQFGAILSFLPKIAVHSCPISLCSSRKNPYPPHGRSLEVPRRREGVLKAKFLEAMYENKLESAGEYGYFLELYSVIQM